MEEDIFEGLPPPSHQREKGQDQLELKGHSEPLTNNKEPSPIPVLKSALKRPNPAGSNPEASAPKKSLRFKTTTDASEAQVIEAMQKIASHIKSPPKFRKASKLAIQLIQARSVKPGSSDHFFALLEAAMSSPTSCTDPSVRADYHALFSAAQDAVECFDIRQRNFFSTWTIRAVVANDLLTDDSFVFSKAAVRIKDVISNLPTVTDDDDIEEDMTLKDETGITDGVGQKDDRSLVTLAEQNNRDESDPFGLDALIPSAMKKNMRAKENKDTSAKTRDEEEEENKRFLKSQRESLITCLEIAAQRYKIPWCQTVIDILVKHAFDNVVKFTSPQRDAIEKLWASVREQQMRRKQGKTVTGKLDVNAFERLQQKYANEKISIRNAVGGGGERRAQQWLG
ncbi:hypothetical protein HS088_TW11G00564 [Tripterygium wilfordii]|uniref:Uncharacterized protein n=2 Tax=Tripterygium wilfordii TaxID=458696 RepID=A0A7J7D2D7_TRIWF|nr:hypothetical protein HS088_TW11G00564 [Tripterygium wilfordii]